MGPESVKVMNDEEKKGSMCEMVTIAYADVEGKMCKTHPTIYAIFVGVLRDSMSTIVSTR